MEQININTYINTVANKIDEISIFNNLKLKSYLGDSLIKDRIFICGKMHEHSIQAKYSFKACDFLVYLPFNDKLFYSEMLSEDCFTDKLKWNFNFFKKIRLCLETFENIKDTYFEINFDKKENNLNLNSENENENENCSTITTDLNKNKNHSENLFIESVNDYVDESDIYLELHFVIDNLNITAFRMRLTHLIDDKPYMTLLNKALELDKIENEKLQKKHKNLYDREKETSRMENEIKIEEENLNQRKKEYLYKFYYLNKEKNIKINEIKNEIKKEKKNCVNQYNF